MTRVLMPVLFLLSVVAANIATVVGGSTDWKLGEDCRALIVAAKGHGKRVHVGRVNSWKRFHKFAGLGCDSADGTFLAFGQVNMPTLMGWITSPIQQQMLSVVPS